jgi:MFS family permease
MAGSVVNALIIPFFGVFSDRVGRRAVYGAGAVMGMLWAFGFFVRAGELPNIGLEPSRLPSRAIMSPRRAAQAAR